MEKIALNENAPDEPLDIDPFELKSEWFGDLPKLKPVVYVCLRRLSDGSLHIVVPRLEGDVDYSYPNHFGLVSEMMYHDSQKILPSHQAGDREVLKGFRIVGAGRFIKNSKSETFVNATSDTYPWEGPRERGLDPMTAEGFQEMIGIISGWGQTVKPKTWTTFDIR